MGVFILLACTKKSKSAFELHLKSIVFIVDRRQALARVVHTFSSLARDAQAPARLPPGAWLGFHAHRVYGLSYPGNLPLNLD